MANKLYYNRYILFRTILKRIIETFCYKYFDKKKRRSFCKNGVSFYDVDTATIYGQIPKFWYDTAILLIAPTKAATRKVLIPGLFLYVSRISW